MEQIDASSSHHQDPDPGPALPQADEGQECPHCYCTPCVTDEFYRQLWWPEARPPHPSNAKLRKRIQVILGFDGKSGLVAGSEIPA